MAVLGNHDYESAKHDEVSAILCEAGVDVLDGEDCEVHGIGFAGVKGFGGGFGRRTLEPWGEAAIKQFVHEAVEEALKLETALARLTTRAAHRRAPLRADPGDRRGRAAARSSRSSARSRLEEPLNRYPVAAVFHGHAHHGSPEGRTSGGIPVYNVALPLLRKHSRRRPPFRIFELREADMEPRGGGGDGRGLTDCQAERSEGSASTGVRLRRSIAAVQCATSRRDIVPSGGGREPSRGPQAPDVGQILLAREQRAAAELVVPGRCALLDAQPREQLVHDPAGNPGALVRVDEAEEDQVA